MRCRSRRAFTLVEVLVALALSAMVLVGARGLLDALGAHSTSVLRSARELDSSMNAEDVLRRALADLVVRSDTFPSFEGDEVAFTFGASCDTPRGWREPCSVRVAAERTDSGYQLVFRQDAGSAVMLRTGLARTALRYLLSADEGGQWTARWQNTLMLPLAVGLIADDDTIVARVGERR